MIDVDVMGRCQWAGHGQAMSKSNKLPKTSCKLQMRSTRRCAVNWMRDAMEVIIYSMGYERLECRSYSKRQKTEIE